MNKKNTISQFSLIMMTVVSVDSIRNLSAAAIFGSEMIFFYILAACLFLLPCAYTSAELASSWPSKQGVYGWVKQAFGPKCALIAIWLQWISNAIWYPAILSFMAATLGYLIHPSLKDNKAWIVGSTIATFWILTFINLKGISLTTRLSNACSILGLILPIITIIVIGIIWIVEGNELNIAISIDSILPSISDISTWVSLSVIMLSFCGMEITTVHINDVQNPQRNYPRALLISCTIILISLLFGSLTLAIIIPSNEISLVAGIMQACEIILNKYNLTRLLPIFGIMLVIGTIGSVSNWIIAPTRGLLVASEDELLPALFNKLNKHNAPSTLLITQAILASIFCCIFLIPTTINEAYLFLNILAVQLYMLMYILMFLSAIILRVKYNTIHRIYQVPGKKLGAIVLSILGILGCTLTFCISFVPPAEVISTGSTSSFKYVLILGLVTLLLPPLFFMYISKRRKKI